MNATKVFPYYFKELKWFNKDQRYRKQREKFYIQKFNTRYRGLNRLNGG